MKSFTISCCKNTSYNNQILINLLTVTIFFKEAFNEIVQPK